MALSILDHTKCAGPSPSMALNICQDGPWCQLSNSSNGETSCEMLFQQTPALPPLPPMPFSKSLQNSPIQTCFWHVQVQFLRFNPVVTFYGGVR